MKGLFLRDLIWIGKQKRMLFILIVLAILYLAAGMGTFSLTFLPFLSSFLCVKTILFDLESSSTKFLFSLPFSRKQYVAEKYLLSLGIPAILIIVIAAVLFLITDLKVQALLLSALLCLALLTVFISVYIPLEIRFRKKAALAGAIGGVTLIFCFLFFEEPLNDLMSGVNLPALLAKPGILIAALIGIMAVSVGISCALSFRLMKNEMF